MTRRAAAVLLLVLAAAVVGLVFLGQPADGSKRPRLRFFLRGVTPAPAAVITPPSGVTPVPAETVRLTLFFPGQDDALLRPEERDIPRPVGPGASLRAIFGELQKGPTLPGLVAVIPPKIQLRNAFLMPEGQVVLDLSMDSGLSFGSDEELSIVAALVDTTLQNVADTTHVRILVNGEPAETLSGHVDLSRPLAYLSNEIASAATSATPREGTPTP